MKRELFIMLLHTASLVCREVDNVKEGTLGESVKFEWRYTGTLELIVIDSDKEEIGEWLYSEPAADNKHRTIFKIIPPADGRTGRIYLTLLSTTIDDYDKTFRCTVFLADGTMIKHTTTLTLRITGEKVSSSSINCSQWLLILLCLYSTNTIFSRCCIVHFIFLLVIVFNFDSVNAEGGIPNKCMNSSSDFLWKDGKTEVALHVNLTMDWKFYTSEDTEKIVFFRNHHNITANKTLAILTPGSWVYKTDILNVRAKKLDSRTWVLTTMHNIKADDISYQYNIRVELGTGCYKYGTPITVIEAAITPSETEAMWTETEAMPTETEAMPTETEAMPTGLGVNTHLLITILIIIPIGVIIIVAIFICKRKLIICLSRLSRSRAENSGNSTREPLNEPEDTTNV